MSSTADGKSRIRQDMRRTRRALPPDVREASTDAINARILARITDGVCAVYLASPEEIDLSAAIEGLLARGVTLVAPRWNGETYELARLTGLQAADLRKGPMGILEPEAADLVSPSLVTSWIVPGLAFTRDGARLGYGGGWYDRLLAEANPAALKFGVAYSFQVLADLPCELHDVRLTELFIG